MIRRMRLIGSSLEMRAVKTGPSQSIYHSLQSLFLTVTNVKHSKDDDYPSVIQVQVHPVMLNTTTRNGLPCDGVDYFVCVSEGHLLIAAMSSLSDCIPALLLFRFSIASS